ncbi:hypothetical protein JXA40_03225 [bacterium]|nr:hypothetical protein [candidate division CSSED10-310 bacterium]
MKKSFLTAIICSILLSILPVYAGWGNEFDNLHYDVGYENMAAQFTVDVNLAGRQMGTTFDLALVPDAPGARIADWLDGLCDPAGGYYQPVACEFFSRLFTEEVIAALNAWWNQFLATVTGFLPFGLHTRQLDWPLNTIGSIRLDDNSWEWPCVWQPETGAFYPISFDVPIETGDYSGLIWTINIRCAINGLVNRDDGYSASGIFSSGAGMVMEAPEFHMGLSFGIDGGFRGSRR